MSVLDVSRAELLALYGVAARLQTGQLQAETALAGKVVLTAFFEASTRTRLSFESAAHRLGAAVMSTADARSTSVHKGESLADTGVMLSAYADLVVLRHTDERSIDDLRSIGMTVPLINGGNGCGEHPTQAMADWYALLKWRGELGADEPAPDRRISLGLVGSPRIMRSLRSFLLAGITHFPSAIRELTIVSELPDPLGPGLDAAVRRAGVRCAVVRELGPHVAALDVVYQNSLTLVDHEYRLLGAEYRIDGTTALQPDAIVMHPLARQGELGTDLDGTPHNLYFDQAEGAVFVRQALLLAVLGRLHRARPIG